MKLRSRFLFWVSGFLFLLSIPGLASGVCLEPPGDVNEDGEANVVDVQCSILSTQFYLSISSAGPAGISASAVPPCVQSNIKRTDTDCSDDTNVTDILSLLYTALDTPLNATIDSDGDQCNDACLTVCGDGLCDAELGENCADCSEDCGACKGDCCENNGSIGCANIKIVSCVCAGNPGCCDVTWDDSCVESAEKCGQFCGPTLEGGEVGGEEGGEGDGPASTCCDVKQGEIGCSADSACESCVCNALPYCCEMAWDEECVKCGAGQGCGENDSLSCEGACNCEEVIDTTNECCDDKSTPGCDSNDVCEACVCALEPSCCSVAWDGVCDLVASGLCNEDCGCFPTSGGCCENNGTAGC